MARNYRPEAQHRATAPRRAEYMAIGGFLKRIERAEQALKAQGHFSPECICFPENEPISFSWPLEQQIAFALKCPLHGDRLEYWSVCLFQELANLRLRGERFVLGDRQFSQY